MRRTAALIKRPATAWKSLPPLLVFTDPARTPDLRALATALPAGAALVYRAFGAADADEVGWALRAITRARGARLLVGADARLARRISADGVHLPERLAQLAGPLKRERPGWIVTCAAHGPMAVRRALAAGADAAVVSTIFASRSSSAGRPMGATRLARLTQVADLPLYALGGVNGATARRLKDLKLAGLAAVDGFGTPDHASRSRHPAAPRQMTGGMAPRRAV